MIDPEAFAMLEASVLIPTYTASWSQSCIATVASSIVKNIADPAILQQTCNDSFTAPVCAIIGLDLSHADARLKAPFAQQTMRHVPT